MKNKLLILILAFILIPAPTYAATSSFSFTTLYCNTIGRLVYSRACNPLTKETPPERKTTSVQPAAAVLSQESEPANTITYVAASTPTSTPTLTQTTTQTQTKTPPTEVSPSKNITYAELSALEARLASHIQNQAYYTSDSGGRALTQTVTSLTTTQVPEGTNFYYTDARVSSYISASSTLQTSMNYWTKTGTDLTYTSGNIGIGTTSPGQKLSVAGDILGNNFIGSYFTATSTTATSTFAGALQAANIVNTNLGQSYKPNNIYQTIFPGTTLPVNWVASGFSVSSGLTPNAVGSPTSIAYWNYQTAMDNSGIRATVNFTSLTSEIGIYRKATTAASTNGILATIDATNNQLVFYHSWNQSGSPSSVKTQALPFTLVTGRDYILTLYKVDRTNQTVTIYDTVTASTTSLSASSVTDLTGSADGAPGVMYLSGASGAVTVKRFEFFHMNQEKPQVIIFGDSITENTIPSRYGSLIQKKLGGNAVVAAVGGENSTNILARFTIDLDSYNPKYVIVNAGKNDTVSATTIANLQTMISRIQANGAIPILSTITPSSPVVATDLATNSWIRSSGYKYIDFATALSIGNTTSAALDPQYDSGDGTHPNSAGHTAMYNQVLANVPELFAPTYSATNLLYPTGQVAIGTTTPKTNAVLQVEGTGDIYFNQTGNIGIGTTTTPVRKLTLYNPGNTPDGIRMQNTSGPNEYGDIIFDRTGTPDALRININGTDVFTHQLNAGQIRNGIGTTTPWRAFSVYGSSDLGTNALAGTFTATSTTVASTFPYASTTALSVSSLTSGRIPYATTGGLFTDNSGLTFDGTKLIATYASTTILSSSGSAFLGTGGSFVGIGTSTMTAPLSVQSSQFQIADFNRSSANGGWITLSRDTGIRGYLGFENSTTGGTLGTGTLPDALDLRSAGALHLISNSAVSGIGITVDTSAQTGIGTTTPSSKLHVYAASALNLTVQNSSVAAVGTQSGITFKGLLTSGADAFMGTIQGVQQSTSANTGDMIISSYSGGTPTEVMRWTSGKFVGIGTTSPAARLSITQLANTSAGGLWVAGTDGDYRAMYISDTSGTLSFNGGDMSGALNTATLNAAGAWTNASDIAYKENITDLNNKYGLNTILATTPRFYTMKVSHIPQVGFVAQELKPLIPEVVDGVDGSYSVSYGNLVAVAFQGIKDLYTMLQTLMTQVTGFATQFTTKKLCVEDVCVTRDEFLRILQQTNVSAVTVTVPTPSTSPAVVVVPTTVVASSTPTISTETTTTTTTTTTTEPAPTVEPTPIPTPVASVSSTPEPSTTPVETETPSTPAPTTVE